MNIVMINGQNHKGSTYNIGRMLAQKVAGENEITELFLPKDLNHFCLGCYSCVEDETKCPFWNEKSKIIEALRKADLFIFTTPNYCLMPSAAMTSFLDLMFDCWMVHRPKDWMFKKRAVIISTSAGASNKNVIKAVKKSLFYWGVPYIKSYGLAVQAKNWDMIKIKKKQKIEKDITKLANSFNFEREPHVGIKTRFIFKIMGGMHEAGFDSSPVEKEYWQEHGWLGKARPWNKK